MRLGGGVLVDLPTSKPSFTAFILWRLFVMSGDDCEAAWAAVTNGSLKASRRMDKSFRLFVHFVLKNSFSLLLGTTGVALSRTPSSLLQLSGRINTHARLKFIPFQTSPNKDALASKYVKYMLIMIRLAILLRLSA